MKAARRVLDVVFEWVWVWLGCGLMGLWRALSAANIWRASPGSSGQCKAEVEDWQTNEALRHYHHGDADESKIKVQTRSHIFHVSTNTQFQRVHVKGSAGKTISLCLNLPWLVNNCPWCAAPWLVSLMLLDKGRELMAATETQPTPPGALVLVHLFLSRWTSQDCRSAVSISGPCLGPEWERRRRASSSWTTCPPPSSTISSSSPSTAGLLSLWTSWTHTSRYEDYKRARPVVSLSLTVRLLPRPWRSAAISWPRPSSPNACQFWRMNSTQTTVGPTWACLRRSAVSRWREPCSPTWAGTCWRSPV